MQVNKTAPTRSKLAITYSRLKKYETCPLNYYEVEVLKNWPEGQSEHLQWGDAVHVAMAKALKDGADLPFTMRGYGKWVDSVKRSTGKLLVEDETKWAIDDQFQPCGWFSPHAWLRCIADAVVIDESHPAAALAVDWKTGKSSNVDEVQLVVIALMLFIHFPKVRRVLAKFVFLKDDAEVSVVMDRKEAPDQWALLMPRIEALQRATATGTFPPKPNNFCKSFCPVKTCEYNGKR